MNERLHNSLIQSTEQLRTRLGRASTRSVLAAVLVYNQQRASDLEFDGGLSSPARQIAFLLGLLLTTPEPADAQDIFKDNGWDRSIELLQKIFDFYPLLMWPTEAELASTDERWRQVRSVAGQALLHFHYTGLMASVIQVAERIEAYLSPFDEVVESEWGIGTRDALRICDHIRSAVQGQVEGIASAIEKERESRLATLDEWERRGWSVDAFREYAATTDYETEFQNLLAAIEQVGMVRKSELHDSFGDKADAYWDVFTIGRGDVELTYITEANPVDTHPMILIGPDSALCTSVNAPYEAVLLRGEFLLEGSPIRERYNRSRDRTLEHQTRECLTKLVGMDADCFENVYETGDSQFEHDLVIIQDRYLYLVEAKASPPKEPFRDLERGFIRLQRAFRSDRGIQKAYEQTERVRGALADGNSVTLYDSSGASVVELTPRSFDDVFAICVTRDDYGPLAVDLGLLLERSRPSSPYPWSIPILSLQTLAMGWEYLGNGPLEFADFLKQRRRLHGKIFCWDELDIVGFYLKHGGLDWLSDPSVGAFHVSAHYADVFDEIHSAIHVGGPPVKLEVTEPFMADVREMFKNTLTELANAKRNDPCPCGSGKKFKKCHGRPS